MRKIIFKLFSGVFCCSRGFQDLLFWISHLCSVCLFLEHSWVRTWARQEICRKPLTGFVKPVQWIRAFPFNKCLRRLGKRKSRRLRWRETSKIITAPVISAWYNVCVLGQGLHVLFSCPPVLHPSFWDRIASLLLWSGDVSRVRGDVSIFPASPTKITGVFLGVPGTVCGCIILDLSLEPFKDTLYSYRLLLAFQGADPRLKGGSSFPEPWAEEGARQRSWNLLRVREA